MKIAVIDSGVNPGHPHLSGIAGGVSITAASETADFRDRLGHGTAVAAAICEKAPWAEIYAVKVFDASLAANIGVIIHAIEWALAQRVDIINLSLGTANPSHRSRFEELLARAAQVMVVSAFEQQGRRLLPGSLHSTIGVVLDRNCPRNTFRAGWLDGRPVFRASGLPRPIPGVPPERNLHGISFAVANMTGFVARELMAGAKPVELRAKLIERATESTVSKGV